MGETIYVTPPDLHLPVQGLRFYFIGGSPEWRQQVQGLVDEVYNSSTVTHYFTPEPIDDKDIPWVIANIYHADLIVANLDIINMLELTFIASLLKHENVWLYSGQGKNIGIVKILNTIAKSAIIEDLPTFKLALDLEAKHG
tara:strand:+ start:573 stop:995 length:423 start_codon:yes stop_codon:yes gene_type:complete